jgi:hypothetical protein
MHHIKINKNNRAMGSICFITQEYTNGGLIPQHLRAKISEFRFNTEKELRTSDSGLFHKCLQFERRPND